MDILWALPTTWKIPGRYEGSVAPIVASILAILAWAIFILFYALYWSQGFTIFQNLIVTLVSLLITGLINLGWKFMEASKAHPVKASLHSFNEWRILETREKPFEILHTGKPISLSGKEKISFQKKSAWREL